MYKILFTFLAALIINQSLEGRNCKADIGGGYRRDNFEWAIAGPENKPSTLSKVSWKGLDIFEMTLQAKKITAQNIYMRAAGDYGWIIRGKNQDSDYRVNDETGRSEEYSRSDNDGGKGNVWDASAGIGYFMRGFCGCFKEIRFVPLIGFAVHEQNLKMINGFQTIDKVHLNLEGHHFHHLNSTYHARWLGPWAGMDIYYHWNDCISMNGSFEYQFLRYCADAHWNLRSDIIGKFHQVGNGHGIFTSFGVDYNFVSGWYLGGVLKFSYAHVNNGKDHRKVAANVATGLQPANARSPDNGQDVQIAQTEKASHEELSQNATVGVKTTHKLHNVKWQSFSILFMIGYNF